MTAEAPERWDRDIDVLHDTATLQKRVAELGAEITRRYANTDLCLVGILKGCFLFFADLIRTIDLPLSTEFIGISSYGKDTESSGVVQITSDLTHSIEGRNVLIVEDIIDTGLTMRYLLDNFATRRPNSLRVCTLLHKPDNARVEVPIDYVGFVIPNEFVIGYGLDLAGRYRNLPYIGVYHGKL
ncbi:MAG: hypoxanthine phosphoribosyltransferase [Myxococcota bacterium]